MVLAISVRPAPTNPAKPKNFTLLHRKRNTAEMPLAAKIADLQGQFTALIGRRSLHQDIPPDHPLNQPLLINVLNLCGSGTFSVPEHSYSIRDREDFLDTMGDVNDPKVLGAEASEHLEENSRGFVIQDGSGFVEDENFRTQGKRFGDFHHLLLGHAQVADGSARINAYRKAVQELKRFVRIRFRSTVPKAVTGKWPKKIFSSVLRCGVSESS